MARESNNRTIVHPDFAPGDDPLRTAWRASYGGLAAAALFSVFINIFKLAAPLYVLQVLSRVLSSGSLETLYMLTAITLLAIVSGILLDVVRRRMFMHWGGWIERTFGPTLFAASLTHAEMESPASSRILRDLGTIRSFVAGHGLLAWVDILWAPVFIACVFFISLVLGYVVLIGCLLALGLGVANELLTRESRNATLRAGRDDRDLVASAESNRETIGSLSAIRSITDLWRRSAFARIDESMQTRQINVYFAAGMRLVGRFVRVGVLGIGVWQVVAQTLTLGPVIAAGVLGRTAYALVQDGMLRWREMVTARLAYGRIKASLQKARAPQISRCAEYGPAPLALEDVSYRYPNQARSVIRGLDIKVEPGELLCVIGPSGSGKTTFSRLASGLVAPRSGNIRLGDLHVHRLHQYSTLREIGYLQQEVTLFPGTVRQNIAGMAAGDMGLVTEAAKIAGIHETILTLPHGYDTEIVDKEPLLSAGQRKGIAVARAIYGIPPLVVLDEPTPHLDSDAREALVNGISQLKAKGSVVVLTTQRKSLAKIGDKVIWLRSSRVVIAESRDKVVRLMRPARDHSGSKRSRRSTGSRSAKTRDPNDSGGLNKTERRR